MPKNAAFSTSTDLQDDAEPADESGPQGVLELTRVFPPRAFGLAKGLGGAGRYDPKHPWCRPGR